MKRQEDSATDLLSLAAGPTSVEEFIEQIGQCVDDPEIQGPSNIPPRSVQLVGLLLGEAIRLIRTGTRSEVAGASNDLSQFLISGRGESLLELDPEAVRLLSAASVALGAASPGGEAMVLRSWGGKAQAILRRILDAEDSSLTLDELLDDVDFGCRQASGPITDLESCGLIIRYRDEADAMAVRARPKSRERHVQFLLSGEA